jgi:amphi-Trp domain-containing protein
MSVRRTTEEDDMAERDIEKVYDIEEFAAKLRRLADALEQGNRFRIQVDGHRINVPKRAEISIEHEKTDDTEELEFQLRWHLGEPDDDGEQDEV